MHLDLQSFRSALLWLPVTLREFLRWRARPPQSSGVRVFYGFDRLPTAGEFSHGGVVKVQDLQPVFPNCPRGANVLYMVSSYLPLFAGQLVRQARASGVKFVLNQNGVAYPGAGEPGWQAVNSRLRAVLRQADFVVYQSRFCRESADQFLGPATCPAEVLYNPVDTKAFIPAITPAAADAFTILLAGSHQTPARVRVALEAVAALRARVPSARLCVAGRYAWRPDPEAALAEARTWAERLGISDSVEFRGPYTQASAVALLQHAQVLLHTKYNDPCPRLVVEAMACGLPVVYSATGGVPELVGDQAGVGVPGSSDYEREHPPAPAALAAALATVAARRSEFSVGARRRAVEQFDLQPWLRRHGEIFNGLISS